MVSSGMLRRVALVITDVLEDLSASFIRLTRIGELGTTLDVTSSRRTVRRNENNLYRMPSSGMLRRVALVTSQETAFLVVTALRTSNLIS
jgi:hypothetical protein